MAQDRSPAPLLDLSTIVDRPTVRIDGKLYELRSRDEFSILTYQQQLQKYRNLGALLQKPKLSKRQLAETARLADGFCRTILMAPPAVQARLTLPQRVSIISVFSQLLPDQKTPAGATPTTNGHGASTPSKAGRRPSRG